MWNKTYEVIPAFYLNIFIRTSFICEVLVESSFCTFFNISSGWINWKEKAKWLSFILFLMFCILGCFTNVLTENNKTWSFLLVLDVLCQFLSTFKFSTILSKNSLHVPAIFDSLFMISPFSTDGILSFDLILYKTVCSL